MKIKWLALLLVLLLCLTGYGQNLHGSAQYRARNDHSGNLIRLTFWNHGMFGAQKGDNSLHYSGEWPINSGMVQLGNASSYVASKLRVPIVADSSKDTTFVEVTPVVFCQGWDPLMFSHDSLGNFLGFEPLPGFYNVTHKEEDPFHAVAMSHQAFTWPPYWPDKMDDPIDPGWPKHWNGYFGKDQKNADQESYFVLDDYMFKKHVSGVKLPLPIPSQPDRGGLGLKKAIRGLQWSNPDAEDCIFWIYKITNFGELELPQTVFGVNVGASIGAKLGLNTDYDDDCAIFYRDLNLTVNYDWDNIGTAGYTPVPWLGFAFLESPGNATDGIDNDGDALQAPGGGKLITTDDFFKSYNVGEPIVLIDYHTYQRTVTIMPAEGIRFKVNGKTYIKLPGAPLEEIPRNGIDDNLNGLIDESDGALAPDSVYYYLYIRDPVYNNTDYLAKDFITGEGLNNLMIDERRDDGIDNDGDWDPNYDDTGLDGKPGTGDPGEGDGLPTPGFGDLQGEPNIDITDVDESDQIGLTSFIFYEYGSLTYSNDEDMWHVSRPGFFDSHLTNVDADYVFSSGYFPLQPGQSESFSVATIYGWDEEDLIRNKKIVQDIYNANYNFAVAPEKPKLQAVVGDGKVTLYWDDRAEKSFDRFLKEYDFEGYKIYRATDPGFNDAGTITDGYGYAYYTKPLAVFDKVDSIYGFFPKSFGRGVQFFLGNESGLVHTFVDSPLVNGLRYFYAVTAYDRGSVEKNIMPSETNKFVTVSPGGEIRTGDNVVAVVPRPPALGYKAPDFDVKPHALGSGVTQGQVYVNFLEPEEIPDGHEYEIQFLDQSMDHKDNDLDGLVDGQDEDEWLPTKTTGFVLKDLTANDLPDTVWFFEYAKTGETLIPLKNLYADDDGNPRTLSVFLRGMKFFIYNPSPAILNIPKLRIFNSVQWSSNIDFYSAYPLRFGVFDLGGFKKGIAYPRQYKIVFFDEIVGQSVTVYPVLEKTGTPIPVPPHDVNFKIYDQQTGEEIPFGFVDASTTPDVPSGFFSAKDRIFFFETLPDSSTVLTYSLLNNAVEDTSFINYHGGLLGAGDTLNLLPDFAFTGNVRYRFRTIGPNIDKELAKESLNKITVVPNPYVVTAAWEIKNPYTSGRGPRSIKFMNLPQNCTIRIYSVDGSLIRKIEHHSTLTDGIEEWDLLSKDQMEIAYGVYVYHISAPGIGEKVGRILIIK